MQTTIKSSIIEDKLLSEGIRSLNGTGKTCYEWMFRNINPCYYQIVQAHLDSELNFSEHISSVCKKASQQIGVLSRLKKLIPTHSKLQLYKAGWPNSLHLPTEGFRKLRFSCSSQRRINFQVNSLRNSDFDFASFWYCDMWKVFIKILWPFPLVETYTGITCRG